MIYFAEIFSNGKVKIAGKGGQAICERRCLACQKEKISRESLQMEKINRPKNPKRKKKSNGA